MTMIAQPATLAHEAVPRRAKGKGGTAMSAIRDVALRATCCVALASLLVASAMAAKAPAVASPNYAQRQDVREFIDEMVRDYKFDAPSLRRFFSKVRYQQAVVNAMSRPVLEPPKWYEYAPRFLSSKRIDAGVAFWRDNAATLDRAQRDFGVDPEVVVAIIGVETFYGRNTGSYRVADALTTLAFDYPRRAEFFRDELKQFLLQTREQKVPPLEPKGSYAGAQGLPQFMPGSVREYALDYDDDGTIDLSNDVNDAIGSVAHYLARHGWLPEDPAMQPAEIEADKREQIERTLDGGISEQRTLDAWQQDGVRAPGIPEAPGSDPTGLLMLEEEDEPSYWMVFNNWYVLTRYNRSRLYASAVWMLAQELKRAYAQE
jgi:membrane-bound lytic murein transglycosylase B